MKFRQSLRILHRDFGYFIVGMTLVYAVSGIYLNHRHDFNPDYRIINEHIVAESVPAHAYSREAVLRVLEQFEIQTIYKKHYITNQGNIKVFIENGEVIINPENGQASITYLKKRPVIFEMNLLHKASIGILWKWISDAMAFILLFVAVSGMFLLKGNRSFARWGWFWTITGIVLPIIFILLYI